MRSQIHWSACLADAGSCGVAIHSPGYTIAEEWFHRSLVDYDLWVILEGSAEVRVDGGDWLSLTRGSCLWLTPEWRYEFRVTGSRKLVMTFIHFNFRAPDGRLLPPASVVVEELLSQTNDPQFFEASVRRIMLIHYLIRESVPERQELLKRQTAHLLQSMLYAYAAQSVGAAAVPEDLRTARHQRVVMEAIGWIHENPEVHCTMEELARRFGYESRYFCRFFLAHTGRTPRQMMIQAKIDHARQFLEQSAMNVGEIAESLGYTNIFYFSRQFRKETGLSPSEYRVEHQKHRKGQM